MNNFFEDNNSYIEKAWSKPGRRRSKAPVHGQKAVPRPANRHGSTRRRRLYPR